MSRSPKGPPSHKTAPTGPPPPPPKDKPGPSPQPSLQTQPPSEDKVPSPQPLLVIPTPSTTIPAATSAISPSSAASGGNIEDSDNKEDIKDNTPQLAYFTGRVEDRFKFATLADLPRPPAWKNCPKVYPGGNREDLFPDIASLPSTNSTPISPTSNSGSGTNTPSYSPVAPQRELGSMSNSAGSLSPVIPSILGAPPDDKTPPGANSLSNTAPQRRGAPPPVPPKKGPPIPPKKGAPPPVPPKKGRGSLIDNAGSGTAGAEDDLKQQLSDLKVQLQNSLAAQEYEKCAALRDQIKKCEEKIKAEDSANVTFDFVALEEGKRKLDQQMDNALKNSAYELCGGIRDKKKLLDDLKTKYSSATDPQIKRQCCLDLQNALSAI